MKIKPRFAKQYFCFLLLLIVCVSVFSQQTLMDEAKNLYPDQAAVFLKNYDHVKIEIKNGQPVIFREVYEDMLVLNEKATGYGERVVFYSSFNELKKLEAYTLLPKGKGYKKQKNVKIIEQNDMASGNFYDDYKAKKIFYPSVQKGARIILHYTEEIKEPRFFGQFFFSSYLPVMESSLSISFPSEMKIIFKLFNIKEEQLQFTQTLKGKKNKYIWTSHNIRQNKNENDAPNFRYFEPHLIVRIATYTSHGNTLKVLSDTGDLYRWYYSLVSGINRKHDDTLLHIVDSLLAGAVSEKEKVTRIYYWVQDHIKYIAFEDGLQGFIPRNASDICRKRYGDCKDMASIITAMLRIAGIPAYIAWIGTRAIPYSFKDVPMPLANNHMIAAYKHNNEYYFLDATGKYTPFGMYTEMIQGKEALVGIDSTHYEIVKVPEIIYRTNKISDSVNISIDKELIKGNGVYVSSGFPKINLEYRYQSLKEEDRKKSFKDFLLKGNNKFMLDTFQIGNMNNREKNTQIDYRFTIDDYLKSNDDEMYINLNLDKDFQDDMLDTAKRKTARELNFAIDYYTTVMLEIPVGYRMEYIPENSSWKNDKYSYTIEYKLNGKNIICKKNIVINTLMLNPEDFPEWNKMIKTLGKAYNESVILKKEH